VSEENFWTLWCKGKLTEADIPTIRLGATPSGPTSAHLHHCIVTQNKTRMWANAQRDAALPNIGGGALLFNAAKFG